MKNIFILHFLLSLNDTNYNYLFLRIHLHLVNPDRVIPDIPDFFKNDSAQAPI
jgi:hypothetical protein